MMKVVALVLVLAASVLALDQDFSSKSSATGSLTPQDYAANPEMFKKQQECLESCSHGLCLKGACVCDQPFCGSSCSRQCQHGGTCSSGPNRCLCSAGWTGEFCEIQEPGSTSNGPAKSPAPKHDKYIMARTIEGGRLPLLSENDDTCNLNRGTLSIPFPSDLDLERVVNVQVMCVDSLRRKIYFGVNDPTSVPIMFGTESKCHGGTNDLVHDTLIQPRSASTDFRYHMDEGTIIVERLGANPELDRCLVRATVTFYS